MEKIGAKLANNTLIKVHYAIRLKKKADFIANTCPILWQTRVIHFASYLVQEN